MKIIFILLKNNFMYSKRNNILKEVDIVEDREYILSRLEKAIKSPTMDIDTVYIRGLKRINNLWKNVL